jgi:hypothetical protein
MAKKIKDENGNTYVQKKPFYKRVWFWLLVVIVVLIGFGSAGSKGGNNPSSSTGNSSSNSSSKINKTNFDKIQISESNGTSKEEVEKMFGKKPSTSSSQSIQGIQGEECVWTGTALGSTVTVGFSNGHAISKGITGLPGSKKITSSQYEAIQNGMSKDEVIQKLGKPSGRTYSSIAGQSAEMLMYDGKGNLGSNMTITITNGAVSGKAQAGMEN